MSFIIDFFTNAQDKEREPAATRAEENAARLKGYQDMEVKQRQYVQWCERKPKVPFANEKSHPMVRRERERRSFADRARRRGKRRQTDRDEEQELGGARAR